MGSCSVPSPAGCSPSPRWMGLVLFCLQLETPRRRDKFGKRNIAHQVTSAGQKE